MLTNKLIIEQWSDFFWSTVNVEGLSQFVVVADGGSLNLKIKFYLRRLVFQLFGEEEKQLWLFCMESCFPAQNGQTHNRIALAFDVRAYEKNFVTARRPLQRKQFYRRSSPVYINIFVHRSSSFYLPNNTTVCTFAWIRFRRAGQQGPIRTLTAALKRSIKTVTGCIFYHTIKILQTRKTRKINLFNAIPKNI